MVFPAPISLHAMYIKRMIHLAIKLNALKFYNVRFVKTMILPRQMFELFCGKAAFL